MTEESLTNILGSDEPQEQETETVETPSEEPEKKEQVEEPAEPTAAPEKEESWTKQAVLDERRKRQELEGKYTTSESEKAELKAKLDEAQKKLDTANTKVGEVSKRPDMFEDPEGFVNYQESAFEKKVTDSKIAMSVGIVKMLKPDYSEMEKVFLEKIVPADSTAIQQLRASENPALFAYEKAREYLDRQDFEENKTSYFEWKKAQEEAAKEAEEKQEEESEEQSEEEKSRKEKAKKSARKVPDLLNATSAKSGVEPKEDLKSILGR